MVEQADLQVRPLIRQLKQMTDRSALDRWLMRNPMPRSFPNKEAKAEFFASMPEKVVHEWNLRKATQDSFAPDFNQATSERAAKRMDRVDAMPPDLRKVVHEYGLEVVQEFINCGVKTPKTIRHLIATVRHEDHPCGQPRFKINKGVSAKQNPIRDDDEYYVIARRS